VQAASNQRALIGQAGCTVFFILRQCNASELAAQRLDFLAGKQRVSGIEKDEWGQQVWDARGVDRKVGSERVIEIVHRFRLKQAKCKQQERRKSIQQQQVQSNR
jgi:hypothetical protein